MKILLISGHGAGDSGAVGCGQKEADLTRTATYIMEGKLQGYDCTVSRYPTARNAYEDNKNGKLATSFKSYGLIVEVHFNSFNASAHGTEVLYKGNSKLAAAVTSAIASCGFTSRGAKERTDLLNMNTCYRLGVPYILIETCFIDNRDDMTLYKEKLYTVWDKVVTAICRHYGIKAKASNGQKATDNGWVKKGGAWYFYKNGEPVKNSWQKDTKGWCYLGKDGKMLTNAWQKDSKGWCFVGSDGRMLTNKWLAWNGASYFLKKDGHMATGNIEILETFDQSGKWVGGREA